jgi:hypothetical protein
MRREQSFPGSHALIKGMLEALNATYNGAGLITILLYRKIATYYPVQGDTIP